MPARFRPAFLSSALFALLLPGVADAAGAKAYVPNFADATLSVIDTATNSAGAPIALPGTNPEGVAVTPDGSRVLVALRNGTSGGNGGNGALAILDTASGTVTATLPTGAGPVGIAISPDGRTIYLAQNTTDGSAALWLVDLPSATVTDRISVGVANQAPFALALSPDGTQLYLVSSPGLGGGSGILQIVTLASQSVGNPIALGADPAGIALTPDGKQLYVANQDDGTVSVVSTTSGSVTAIVPVGTTPFGLAVTPDGGQLWVANAGDGTITILDTASNSVTATIPAGSGPGPTAIGFTPDGKTAYVPDGGLFADLVGTGISVIDVASRSVTATIAAGNQPLPVGSFIGAGPSNPALASAVLPTSRAVEIGTPATVFATLLNISTNTVQGCSVALPASAPPGLVLDYQTTDPASNLPTGQKDTPVTLPAGGSQSFLLSFDAATSFDQPGLPLIFACDEVPVAASVPGLNTVDLLYSATPVADIIALAATVTPGVVQVPTGGSAAFAVASDNAGADGTLTVSADTGSAALPLTLALCQTNPSNGACLAPPAASLSLDIPAGATPTFSVFVTATASIPFDPAGARVFMRFEDSSGVSHGATSVAVETD